MEHTNAKQAGEENSLVLTRRAFLSGVVLGSAATLAGCATAGISFGSAGFSFGPTSAEVTSRSALVWLRARGRSRITVEYSLDRDLPSASVTSALEATPETDYTVLADLTGLLPGREYFYRGLLLPSGSSAEPMRGPMGRFRTAPEDAREFRFAWSGDMEAGHQPFALFDRVIEKEPSSY